MLTRTSLRRYTINTKLTRPQLFKKVDITIHWIAQLVSRILIHWIVIYPVDSAIQRLNNCGQKI